MNMIYIQSKELILNPDHIISAEYSAPYFKEAERDLDGDGHMIEAHHVKARLNITTTELDLEQDTFYDGNVRGVASKSQIIHISGDEAELLWECLKKESYYIGHIFHPEVTADPAAGSA